MKARNNEAAPEKEKTAIFKIVVVILVMITIGTFSFHYLERWNYVDSFYFAVATLTTVGYGDMVPSTQITRIFTAFYILIGVSIFFYGLFSVGEHFVEERIMKLERRLRRQDQIKIQTKTQEEILKEILKEYHENYNKPK
jgi:voltage-gated potassium channel Kch